MVLTAICFAFVGVLVKLIDNNVHFMTLNFFRVFLGLLCLLVVIPVLDKNIIKINMSDFKFYALSGFVLAISISFTTTSLVFAPVHNAVLIHYIYPFFLLVFSYFMLKEKITKTKIISLLIAFAGIMIINPFSADQYLLGNCLAFGGAFSFAILIALMRKMDMSHSIGSAMWLLFFASFFLLPFPLIFGVGKISNYWVYVLLLGIVSTGLAYLFYNLALEKLEAEICAIIATIFTPLVSIILAVLIIDEHLSLRIILGGLLLIISGIYLETHLKNKSEVKIHKSPVRVQ